MSEALREQMDFAVNAAMQSIKDAIGDFPSIVIIASFEDGTQDVTYSSMATTVCCPTHTAEYLTNIAEALVTDIEKVELLKRAIN